MGFGCLILGLKVGAGIEQSLHHSRRLAQCCRPMQGGADGGASIEQGLQHSREVARVCRPVQGGPSRRVSCLNIGTSIEAARYIICRSRFKEVPSIPFLARWFRR